jgi:hypothetical protein
MALDVIQLAIALVEEIVQIGRSVVGARKRADALSSIAESCKLTLETAKNVRKLRAQPPLRRARALSRD